MGAFESYFWQTSSNARGTKSVYCLAQGDRISVNLRSRGVFSDAAKEKAELSGMDQFKPSCVFGDRWAC